LIDRPIDGPRHSRRSPSTDEGALSNVRRTWPGCKYVHPFLPDKRVGGWSRLRQTPPYRLLPPHGQPIDGRPDRASASSPIRSNTASTTASTAPRNRSAANRGLACPCAPPRPTGAVRLGALWRLRGERETPALGRDLCRLHSSIDVPVPHSGNGP